MAAAREFGYGPLVAEVSAALGPLFPDLRSVVCVLCRTAPCGCPSRSEQLDRFRRGLPPVPGGAR